ncbi:hypothetical protein [Virgisporangium ochraceum]|uniref:Uncharacterized protein n=1 Tax=Virgisporangium ochraceum TaxID=65505 RepID=A0A8J3ZXP0_9ACTN|nr:hypothetical protein [Virgisporangium ochraceum]GIJ71536.1 hypothetical protein Voc01_064530 [Virgisporangium ochraceum]
MPTIRELLNRFRPAGTPGAAAGAAVPADRAAELAAELAPVFVALAPATAKAAEIRSAAVSRAEARRADAAATAARILADARRSVDVERAAGFSEARDGVAEAATALAIEGRQAADATAELVRQRLPGCVERVVGSALDEAGVR